MATPVCFDGVNKVLSPPAGEEANVIPLPVHRSDGRFVSCWMPSAEEIAEILRTGRIWLSVWGRETAPPVYVSGHQAEVL